MALLHLVASLAARGTLPPVTVGTVDHGLRPGSGAVASVVEAEARARSLPARCLSWAAPKPTRAVQERARIARYDLLVGLCREVGADHLVTAHTLDDQAETVLFRLLRGSGIGGLAGMRSAMHRDGLRHVRPLLGVAKARLVATCAAEGVPVHDDPANHDPRFARTRLRGLLPLLAAEGGDATVLARLARRAARAEDALGAAAEAAYADALLRPENGALRVSASRLLGLPGETIMRVLGLAVAAAGGEAGRLGGLERLSESMVNAARRGLTLRRSLGGTVLTLTEGGVLEVRREGLRRRGSLRRPGSLGKAEPDAYIRDNGSSALS